ncbi:hypothetical protein Tco_1253991 [Tanacetum coccineum]
MSEPMPTIPTQSPFTYPNPNPSASPSFTQDDTSESFIPEPTQPMPTFTQTAFSQPAVRNASRPFSALRYMDQMIVFQALEFAIRTKAKKTKPLPMTHQVIAHSFVAKPQKPDPTHLIGKQHEISAPEIIKGDGHGSAS